MSTRTRFENEATVVRKFSLTSRPIKCKNYNRSQLGHSRFPALQMGCLFYSKSPLVDVNPLIPMNDQDGISPNNINTESKRQVMRTEKRIN